jgi:glycine/D-amino acid oxidase-like deaminating enzyme
MGHHGRNGAIVLRFGGLQQVDINRPCLTRHEHNVLVSLASAALPRGGTLAGAGAWSAAKLEAFLSTVPVQVRTAFRAILLVLDAASFARYRRSLASLSRDDAAALLTSWHTGAAPQRLALRALLTPLKIAHFNDAKVYGELGCVFRQDPVAAVRALPVFEARVIKGQTLTADQDVEADAAVIGTGAGGAVVAKELAERGFAVAVFEEGDYHKRDEFRGHTLSLQRKLFRDMGATFALGNTGIMIPLGRNVGGSTTVNAGTCFRTPERVLGAWRQRFGLTDLTPELMNGCFERVEGVLRVALAQDAHLGGIARVIARGCDALGWKHGALLRNAPDCEGSGVCMFGCPTDAKRSTNVSYIPMALKAGAVLYTGARVERLLTRDGRAVGLQARTAGGALLRVRARATVVACGALLTPVLLMRNRLCGASGQLGRNLSLHPCAGAGALFEEPIRGWNAIPQGYSIYEFADQGIRFEGAFMPPDLGAAMLPFFGRRLVEVIEQYDRFASFGFMIEDRSRGRVRVGPGGRPLITYLVGDEDVGLLKRGLEALSRVFFAAGARTVFPFVAGFDELRSDADLERLLRARLRARDFDLSAFHPLGTARMGVSPTTSVVGQDLEAHDVRGLYVCDGSVVPSALGVNPQVTIMALATHGADRIARALE